MFIRVHQVVTDDPIIINSDHIVEIKEHEGKKRNYLEITLVTGATYKLNTTLAGLLQSENEKVVNAPSSYDFAQDNKEHERFFGKTLSHAERQKNSKLNKKNKT